MLEHDLQVGDILFFMDASKQPLHVAIYQGFRADTHFVTHAVTAPYHCIMTTRLKSEPFPYRVFRSNDAALGMLTANRMRMWAENKIPFSQEKHELYEEICDDMCHPKTGGAKQCAYAMQYFPINFYRYIEFSAHPELPYYPHKVDPQGMYCSESLTAAINIESLLVIGAVFSCKEMNVSWVTDSVKPELLYQYINALPKEKQPHPNYHEYLKTSHSPHEYTLGNLKDNCREENAEFYPSFSAWRYDRYPSIEDFIKYYEHPLPLDSKISTPWAMLHYFENNPQKWTDCGELIVSPIIYPLEKLEANKVAWQDYVSSLFEKALDMHERVRVNVSELSLNPRVDPISPIKVKASHSFENLNSLLNSPRSEVNDIASQERNKSLLKFTSPNAQSTPKIRKKTGIPKRLFTEFESESSSSSSSSLKFG